MHNVGVYVILVISVISSAFARNPVLLISLDGFRADKFDKFLSQNPNSNLQTLINRGVKAEYMKPAFPSFTFPNHWTLVTGLYPESHGVIANSFYDPKYNETVALQSSSGLDIKWWNATEPIWLTAKKQGLKTATSFWPGSETWPYVADIYLPFMKYADKNERAKEVVGWFDKFQLDFATLYYDQPDGEGHAFGPDSPEYAKMIEDMDLVIGNLITELKAKKVYDNLNIVLVSDHGMAEAYNQSSYIVLSDFFDTSMIDLRKTTYSKVSQVYTKEQSQEADLIVKINAIPHVTAYLKKDVPAEFNYNNNDRIGQIVVVAEEGYLLANSGETFRPGHHGYNNSLESMRAIFIASGPDIEQKSDMIKPFDNVNIYPLLCQLLEINCHKSNGTLALANELYLPSGSHMNIFNVPFTMILILLAFMTK